MALSKQIVYIGDFYDKAQELIKTWGKTDLYSTGFKALDDYFCGGFGRPNGYEIVLLYGPTGIGKSTVALNLISPAISSGAKIGLLVLEDDMADVSNRLSFVLTKAQYSQMNSSKNVRCLPEDAMTKSWTLPDLLDYIEMWFNDGVDLILLDHLQFAFENSESIKGENEYAAQRVFMQKLNQVMKKTKKTIVLVSHVNKMTGAKGMDKIVGSGSIAQAATKVIEISDDEMENVIRLDLKKSRFTKRRTYHYCMKMIGSRLEPAA
jgi:predicted ATP-dependent serine protease